MNEADTRAELIDPQLKSARWGKSVNELTDIKREHPVYPGQISRNKKGSPLSADYVLIYKNRKLAAIEAKADEVDVSEGVAQAKNYATLLNLNYTFAANGKEIKQMRLDPKEEKLVEKFPTPDELWELCFPEDNEWLDKFNAVPFHDFNRTRQLRYYQEIAVNKTMEAIANNQDRILLTLATGTGKTFIAFQIAWKLFQSRWTTQKDGQSLPRILFLADRNILANQDYNAFEPFGESARVRIQPNQISRRGGVPLNGSVFFTIFQSLMSGDNHYYKEYPADFFDFIVIDECHRGGAHDESSWRDIMNYFRSAVQLGLTATPKRENNSDTYKYFGDPIYTYSLKQGIKDGFLTPFKVDIIESSLDEYEYEEDDEVIEGLPERDKVYKESDFNTKIVIEERERHRVKEFLSRIRPRDKTLVFCANQAHAGLVRDMVNEETPNQPTDYCERVTANDGEIGDQHLRTFQDNEKEIPTILTTSRKLSTGVDALNVRNIVLLRPVKNMIEFKQIIGRGTRLFDGKFYFTVYDFVKAYENFEDKEWDGEPEEPVNPPIGRPPVPPDDIPPRPPIEKIKIKLAEGKELEITSHSSRRFMLDGNPVELEVFIKHIFRTLNLPDLFTNEQSLRETWSNPITRKELLKKLSEEGISVEDLKEIQSLIDAEDSDLFDVLEYIAFSQPTITRQTRVESNKQKIFSFLNENQRDFIQFILANYVSKGYEELDDSKLKYAIDSKYGDVNDAEQKLGSVDEIRKTFLEFQKYLYEKSVA